MGLRHKNSRPAVVHGFDGYCENEEVGCVTICRAGTRRRDVVATSTPRPMGTTATSTPRPTGTTTTRSCPRPTTTSTRRRRASSPPPYPKEAKRGRVNKQYTCPLCGISHQRPPQHLASHGLLPKTWLPHFVAAMRETPVEEATRQRAVSKSVTSRPSRTPLGRENLSFLHRHQQHEGTVRSGKVPRTGTRQETRCCPALHD